MKLQTVGFEYYLSPERRVDIMIDVINGAEDVDLILFPGHTLRNIEDAKCVRRNITNKHTKVVFELESCMNSVCMIKNAICVFENGRLINLYTGQLFSTNKDIDGNTMLMGKFFDELPRRMFTLCGSTFCIIQCGENSFLKGDGKNGLVASFRFDEQELVERERSMLDAVDVFLNPIHSIQGEQGVMKKRRDYLSGDGRYYFSTSSLDYRTSGNLKHKSLQYGVHDGMDIPSGRTELGDYILKTYEF